MTLILLNEVANLEDDYEVASVDLTQQYWYPEKEAETRRMIFWEISQRKCIDQQTQEEIELDCAVFVVPGDPPTTVANGSKRLVAVFENNEIKQGTPVQVTYNGNRKNKTNQNSSDHWSVVTLVKKGASK